MAVLVLVAIQSSVYCVGLMGLDRNVVICRRTTGLLGLVLHSCVRTSGMSYVFPLRTSGISL